MFTPTNEPHHETLVLSVRNPQIMQLIHKDGYNITILSPTIRNRSLVLVAGTTPPPRERIDSHRGTTTKSIGAEPIKIKMTETYAISMWNNLAITVTVKSAIRVMPKKAPHFAFNDVFGARKIKNLKKAVII